MNFTLVRMYIHCSRSLSIPPDWTREIRNKRWVRDIQPIKKRVYELTFETWLCSNIHSLQSFLALRTTIKVLLYKFCWGMLKMTWLFIKWAMRGCVCVQMTDDTYEASLMVKTIIVPAVTHMAVTKPVRSVTTHCGVPHQWISPFECDDKRYRW